MPATRVTVASNSKQSQKTPLLIPPSTSLNPNVSPSCSSLIIKTAQAKLRLKKASRIFVHGGRELTHDQDWKDVLKNDVTFLVSCGEEYVGLKQYDDPTTKGQPKRPATTEANPACSIELLAENAFVDSLSITQLETSARTLPGIIHAVGQPDLHPGTKFPIGSVFVSKGWIHPPLIGGDIGCGMAWYKTKLPRSQVEGDRGKKIAEKLRGLEGRWRTAKAREVWLEASNGTSFSAGAEWDASLGTIGAGNHFAEIQVVEESTMTRSQLATEAGQHELYEGEVVLLIHSGSRGYGSHILKHFTKDGGRDSIREDEPVAKDYVKAHDRACAWASLNRDLIALRFLACLAPGDKSWDLGINNVDLDGTPGAEVIRNARWAVQNRKVVDIYHNNVEHITWPSSSLPLKARELHNGIADLQMQDFPKAWIHRKGAAPIHNPHTNFPLTILPLPGSRATPTLILHPTFTSLNTHGHTNALSLAHGAGRALSRAKAATYVAEKYGGRADELLRGDFVRSDKHGNKSHGSDSGRDVNGGCVSVSA